MKKLLLTTLLTGSLLLTACQADTMKAADAKKNLEGKSYNVSLYDKEETKARIKGIEYDDNLSFTECVYASKGKDDDQDLLLAFFFKNVKDAEAFVTGEHGNIAAMNTYIEINLGKNLKPRIGSHNNVAYCGSETSFAAAFPGVL